MWIKKKHLCGTLIHAFSLVIYKEDSSTSFRPEFYVWLDKLMAMDISFQILDNILTQCSFFFDGRLGDGVGTGF